MVFCEELALLIRARAPLINVVTYDEARLIDDVAKAVADGASSPQSTGIYSWDMADQFTCHKEGNPPFDVSKPATPDTILGMIEGAKCPSMFILKDFHHVWEAKKTVIRKLRNLSFRLPRSPVQRTIIITTPESCLPPELKHDCVQLELPKPDAAAIGSILRRVVGEKSVDGRLTGKISSTALGLSATQAELLFRKAFASSRGGRLDELCLDLIRDEKCRIIRQSGALEFVASTEMESSVGGLEALRGWLTMRKEAFTDRAAAYGLEAPSGIALVGIPGTGKSLCAKVTASMWRMPLIRLDIGAVFSGVLGSSERNIRDAIEISELVSPCILWVDEIEKAFAGSAGDSGTASRVLATFLTWMEEKKKPVCVAATANDVGRLPPEFLRKGRFDEVFFLDLPTREERGAILSVHLQKRGYGLATQRFDLKMVLDVTEGFVGAELEALVKDAMFPAFMDGERQIETDDLVKSAAQMVPLAKSRADHIEKLRDLVKRGEARNASKAMADEEVKCDRIRDGRLLDLK